MYIKKTNTSYKTIAWIMGFITEWDDTTDALCGWRKKFAKDWTRGTGKLRPKLAKRRAAPTADG